MQVRCYWNLHKSCWSVQDAKTRRVIGHADKVLLREARFTVSQAGRQRVLEEGRKNVHAFACGELHGAKWLEYGRNTDAMLFDWSPGDRAYERAAGRLGRFVSYNPRVDETFVEVSLNSPVRKPRREAPMALLTRTPSKPRKAALLVFDPCDMTDEESRAATV
jgi:hypothetical protein